MADFFEEMRKKEQQLDEQLAGAPLVDLVGIVSSRGAGAVQSGGDEFWTLVIDLPAWRIGNGPLQTNEIRLRRKVTHDEIDHYRQLITADMVMKFRARVVEQTLMTSPQAYLDEFLGVETSDSELHDYLAKLLTPITHHDATLGLFTFDRNYDLFYSETRWLDTPITLNLEVRSPKKITAALTVAHTLWEDAATWDERVRAYAIQELLQLKNESWREADEELVTPAQFLECMTLESIAVNGKKKGSFEFWYNDGDLFWGHTIQISGNLSDGPNAADILG